MGIQERDFRTFLKEPVSIKNLNVPSLKRKNASLNNQGVCLCICVWVSVRGQKQTETVHTLKGLERTSSTVITPCGLLCVYSSTDADDMLCAC